MFQQMFFLSQLNWTQTTFVLVILRKRYLSSLVCSCLIVSVKIYELLLYIMYAHDLYNSPIHAGVKKVRLCN